jgi:hypothetical protein
MNKRGLSFVVAGCAVVLAAGVLFASEMWFKMNYPLLGPGSGGSATGTNTIALPYRQQTDIVKAKDLIDDINAVAGSSVVTSVSRFVKSTDGIQTYHGMTGGVDFDIVPGEGYIVQVNSDVNYIIVGGHNAGLLITLDGRGYNGSVSGTNFYAPPYHSPNETAGDLLLEINGPPLCKGYPAAAVQKWDRATDGVISYDGCSGVDFPLRPGEPYFVVMRGKHTFLPSHY